jgi:DNA-binding GntR family transcriptional regulator
MVRARDPFGVALSSLRQALRDGIIAPGQPLLAAELATELKISATPVREALSRLAGEGLLDDRRGRGFFALRPTAVEVEEFYSLHGSFVHWALEINDLHMVAALAMATEQPHDPLALRRRAEQFWGAVVQRADGGVLSRLHRLLTDQLALIRLLEPLVLADVERELEGVITAAAQSKATFLTVSDAYHARRCEAARILAGKVREWPINPSL